MASPTTSRATPPEAARPSTFSHGVARTVSIVLHPFVLAPAIALVSEWTRDARAPWRLPVIVMLLVVAPLALLMRRQTRTGRWATVDASRPSDRPLLFLVALGSLAALRVGMALVEPSTTAGPAVTILMGVVVVCAAVTSRVKLSLHMLVLALAASVLEPRAPMLAWGCAALLPLLGWSRVALERHRWSEVVLGTLVGVAAGVAIVWTT